MRRRRRERRRGRRRHENQRSSTTRRKAHEATREKSNIARRPEFITPSLIEKV
jgi:hypothetical protein